MSTVELVMTDTRVWAVGPATHWEVPPSVVLGSNGNLVVGESLTPPTQVSSAVQFVPAERIALLPRVPTVVESMAAVVDAVFENLGVASPAERVTVVCPTEWGGRRRSVVDAAVRRFTAEVTFEEMAIRSVTTDLSAARASRSVVLEFGAITTTASTVTPGLHGPQLESCEFEPDLAVTDLGVDPRAALALSSLLGTLLDGRQVDIVRVVGVSTPAQLEAIRSSVQEVCGPAAEVRPVTGADLVRSAQPQPQYRPAPAFPANEWLQPLRERAAAQQDPKQRRTMYILGAVATVVVIAAAVIGAVVALGGSDDDATAAPPPTGTVTAPAPSTPPRIAAPTTPPGPTPEVFGRIRFQTPDGWKATPATGGSRVDLAPLDGTKLRITVIQGSVAPNAGYEQIAADLADQMKQKPTISDLRRDVVFGGRSMLAYTERPEGGSTVRWHILVEHGIQVSIGCQYAGNGWDALATTCDKFAASVDVMP